ncbi:MAG TPA: hypothetical protein VJO54_00875 [Burkholderiales bacterium]|nr:hypothetical protein [Burkholderiales bacterium]
MRKFLAFALTLLPAAAMADTSIGVRAGTLGLGLELSYPISQRIGVRLNADSYKYSKGYTQDGIDYDGKATLKTGSLLLDFYPFANNFRISAGPMYNGNKLGLSTPTTSLTVNGNPYQASLDGHVDFKKYVPYAGIGYGRPIGTGLSLTFDLGVVFQGTPKATLTGTCTGACAGFQNDVAAQEASLNDSIKDFRYYPVVTLGLAYTF